MSGKARLTVRALLLFTVAAVALAALLAAAGQEIAGERFGDDHARAWLAGCGVSLVASLASGLGVWIMSGSGASGVTAALGSMLVRLAVLGLLGAGTVVVFGPDVRPFLLAVAASHLALLIVDTGFLLAVVRAPAIERQG